MWKNAPFGRSYIRNEMLSSFNIVSRVTLRLIYGAVLNAVCVVGSDGDQQLIDSLEEAIKDGYLGTEDKTKLKRCYFHAVLQTFLKSYACIHRGNPQVPRDNGVGDKALGWIRYMFYKLEKVDQLDKHYQLLTTWINNECRSTSSPQFVEGKKTALLEWVDSTFRNRREIAVAYTVGIYGMQY